MREDLTPQRPLVILGTRMLAEEVLDLAHDIPGCRVEAFIENLEPARCQEKLDGLPVLWVDRLAELAATHQAVCALSTTLRTRFVDQAAALGMTFARLVHPSAQIASRTTLAEGVIINRGVMIGTKTQLGRHVFVNRGALIGHHTVIGEFTSIQPGANVAGACGIGAATYIGMGAIIVDRTSVGAHSVVAAGAVVTRDLPERVLAMGVPARIVKEGIEGK